MAEFYEKLPQTPWSILRTGTAALSSRASSTASELEGAALLGWAQQGWGVQGTLTLLLQDSSHSDQLLT